MKQFNSLAKNLSDYHSKSKSSSKNSEMASSPSPGATDSTDSDASMAMHEALEDQICPGCHAKVKELMHKHGISSETGKQGSTSPSEMHE